MGEPESCQPVTAPPPTAAGALDDGNLMQGAAMAVAAIKSQAKFTCDATVVACNDKVLVESYHGLNLPPVLLPHGVMVAIAANKQPVAIIAGTEADASFMMGGDVVTGPHMPADDFYPKHREAFTDCAGIDPVLLASELFDCVKFMTAKERVTVTHDRVSLDDGSRVMLSAPCGEFAVMAADFLPLRGTFAGGRLWVLPDRLIMHSADGFSRAVLKQAMSIDE